MSRGWVIQDFNQSGHKSEVIFVHETGWTFRLHRIAQNKGNVALRIPHIGGTDKKNACPSSLNHGSVKHGHISIYKKVVTFQILPFSSIFHSHEYMRKTNAKKLFNLLPTPLVSLSRHGPSRWTQQLWSCDGSCCINQVPLNIEDFHSEHIICCLHPEGSTGMSGILMDLYPCKSFSNVAYPSGLYPKQKLPKPTQNLRALFLSLYKLAIFWIYRKRSHFQSSSWAKYYR